ncbi:MAG TPA: hypothetical protein VJP59_05940 [Gemmatimonadota bacterium]|nr:hypothetical protein [Gemmatimonadota bacterium]
MIPRYRTTFDVLICKRVQITFTGEDTSPSSLTEEAIESAVYQINVVGIEDDEVQVRTVSVEAI